MEKKEEDGTLKLLKKLHTAAVTTKNDQLGSSETIGSQDNTSLKVTWVDIVKSTMSMKIDDGSTPVSHLEWDLHRHSSDGTEEGKAEKESLLGVEIFVGDDEDIKVPEWFEELSDDQVSAFKQLFDIMDEDSGGYLNADELYEGLKRVDSAVTMEEVEAALKVVDQDGNGGISFDEFLYMMTQMGMDDEEDDEGVDESGKPYPKRKSTRYTKRQRLFYSAITQFNLENAMPPTHQSPHVLSHYTAGMRLIGLSNRQLENHFRQLRKGISQEHAHSPYAKPLPMVPPLGPQRKNTRTKKSARRNSRNSQASKLRKGVKNPNQNKDSEDLTGTDRARRTSINRTRSPSQNAKGLAQMIPKIGVTLDDTCTREEEKAQMFQALISRRMTRSSVVSQLPDMVLPDMVPMLQSRIDASLLEEDEDGSRIMFRCPSPVEKRNSSCRNIHGNSANATRGHSGRSDSGIKRHRNTDRGWNIPKLDRDKVPLPVIKIKYKGVRPTIEDLPNIREKVSQVLNDYYLNLRGATVRNAWEHWDKLYAGSIRSSKLQQNFKAVYRAYSPHKAEEAFVVCPWVPGPFRQLHTGHPHPGRNAFSSCGDYRIRSCHQSRNETRCNERPLSATP